MAAFVQHHALPRWGVGIECPNEIDCQEGFDDTLYELGNIEFICEGLFLGKRRDFLRRLAFAGTPVIGHSIELSIGSDEPLKLQHLERIKEILGEVNTVSYSDHLCMTEMDGIEIGQLTTLPWTWHTVDVTCRKVERVQKIMPWPVMLENITNRFIFPGNDLTEPNFINAIMGRTGCGLLLDVTNLYTNAVNFRFDPYEWFAALNKNFVRGIHLAGGEWEQGVLYDTHSRPVYAEVWELFRHVVSESSPDQIVVEWDQDTPTLDTLMAEVRKADAILDDVHHGARADSANEVFLSHHLIAEGVTP